MVGTGLSTFCQTVAGAHTLGCIAHLFQCYHNSFVWTVSISSSTVSLVSQEGDFLLLVPPQMKLGLGALSPWCDGPHVSGPLLLSVKNWNGQLFFFPFNFLCFIGSQTHLVHSKHDKYSHIMLKGSKFNKSFHLCFLLTVNSVFLHVGWRCHLHLYRTGWLHLSC